jgi:hypothetical protein
MWVELCRLYCVFAGDVSIIDGRASPASDCYMGDRCIMSGMLQSTGEHVHRESVRRGYLGVEPKQTGRVRWPGRGAKGVVINQIALVLLLGPKIVSSSYSGLNSPVALRYTSITILGPLDGLQPLWCPYIEHRAASRELEVQCTPARYIY